MTKKTFDPSKSFRNESADLVVQLEDALMNIEDGNHSQDVINSAFRAMHTLKGSGSMFGFEKVAEFTHHFETAFDKVRSGEVEITEDFTDVCFKALDYIKEMLMDSYNDDKASGIIAELEKSVGPPSSSNGASTNTGQKTAGQPEDSSGQTRTYEIVFYPHKDTMRFGGKLELILDELRELGEADISFLDDKLPSFEKMDPEATYMGWRVILKTEAMRDDIDTVFMFHEDDSELSIKELANRKEDPKPGTDTAQTTGASSPVNTTIRIPSERLDAMMDQVGELVIAQSRLAEISDKHNDAELRSVAEDIERLVMELRDQTLGVRMLPIAMLFSKFKRVVRDLSKDLDKSVELITEGEDTEVDKSFIDKLNDPIVHLIRNSLDHGIEDSMTREMSDKDAKGKIHLSASQAGGEILITIQDDGKGLNTEKIKEKAIENGLISEGQDLSETEIHNLIFEPGFSTAQQVSSVSGRGVGMDVVRSTIEEMRGKIDVKSVAGKGSTFTLRLPLTLAIIEGYHIQVGNEVFVMPLEIVEECVELSKEDDKQSEGRSLISIRDEFVPFVRLHDYFGFDYPDNIERRVVVVNVKGKRTGLVVDHIFGQRQTVIKPLTKLHKDISGLAGATILGDGRVALILDVSSLLDNVKNNNKAEAA